MEEVVSYRIPCSLRYFFATLLVYSDPSNPRELWEKFEAPMSDDFKNLPNSEIKNIQYIEFWTILMSSYVLWDITLAIIN